jgi:pimeloyl-ACP methyl ester carboxylesterase
MWGRIRRNALIVLSVLMVLWSAGMIYQWNGAAKDAKFYKPAGKLYEVSGHKMHLYTAGEGDDTVVFASGWGTANPYADFSPLYDKLEPHVKIAVCDRFGYGYSDTTGKPRDIDTITDEIHELLRISGQTPPYIFVGHSLGALETIRYAQRYPSEVKAILLIEGGSPEYYASRQGFTFIPMTYRMLRTSGVLRALYHIEGFDEWASDQSNGEKLLTEDMKRLNRAAILLKSGNPDMTDEMRQSQKNAEIILAGKKPLDIPITVLTADYFGKLSDDKAWMDSEAALPSWSLKGKQVIVPGSSHYIHSYQPEAVVSELLKLAEN